MGIHSELRDDPRGDPRASHHHAEHQADAWAHLQAEPMAGLEAQADPPAYHHAEQQDDPWADPDAAEAEILDDGGVARKRRGRPRKVQLALAKPPAGDGGSAGIFSVPNGFHVFL